MSLFFVFLTGYFVNYFCAKRKLNNISSSYLGFRPPHQPYYGGGYNDRNYGRGGYNDRRGGWNQGSALASIFLQKKVMCVFC